VLRLVFVSSQVNFEQFSHFFSHCLYLHLALTHTNSWIGHPLGKRLISHLLNKFLTDLGSRNFVTKFMISKSRPHTVPNKLVLTVSSHFFRVLDPPVYT